MPNASLWGARWSARTGPRTGGPRTRPRLVRAGLGPLLTVSPALLFAWWHPTRNAWPALALGLALALDAVARLASELARQRTGLPAAFHGVASPLLALGGATWLGGAVVAAGAALRPDLFPLLASALAGLVAMGACARLSLAWAVMTLHAAEREAGRERADGREDRR